MRLYVLCFSDHEGIAPHIIAEVVRESVEDDRATSLASALAGERSLILTRIELLADQLGREALEAWEDRNDGEFRQASEAILADDTPTIARLRLVTSHDAAPAAPVSAAAMDEQENVFFRSIALRAVSRVLIERAREQRVVRDVTQGVDFNNDESLADND
jgi:hypothetical protein